MPSKSLDHELEKPGRSYDADLYGWVENQVALLQAHEVGSIDASHITQELEDLGRSEFDKLASSVRVILRHLLKWDYQPERRSRSWMLSIDLHRQRVVDELRDSPSLKNRISQAIGHAYSLARREAVRETGLPVSTFPEDCAYHWDDITSRPIEWGGETSPDRQRRL